MFFIYHFKKASLVSVFARVFHCKAKAEEDGQRSGFNRFHNASANKNLHTIKCNYNMILKSMGLNRYIGNDNQAS